MFIWDAIATGGSFTCYAIAPAPYPRHLTVIGMAWGPELWLGHGRLFPDTGIAIISHLSTLTFHGHLKYVQDSHLIEPFWNTIPQEALIFLQVVKFSLCDSYKDRFCCHNAFAVCSLAIRVFTTQWIHHWATHYRQCVSVCLYYCHNQKAGLQWNICFVHAYLLSEGPFNLNGALSVMSSVNEWVCEGLRAVQCGKNAIISF